MVTIYPMLVSNAVSENVIPGIAKTLESYIIVHNMNDVLTNPAGPRQLNYKIKSGRIFAKESEDLSEAVPPGSLPGTKGKGQAQLPAPPEDEDEDEEKEKEKEKEAKDAGKEKTRVNISDKGITLEPTYMTVEVTKANGQLGTEFIGVKVVPLRVKSDSKLLDMLMYDHQMRGFQSLMVTGGRKILGYAYKIIDKWTGRLGSRIPSGDIRQDVVLGRSGFKGQPFIVVDKGQDFNESFFSKPARINRLFKMGWGNIVIVDSINRQAYFCLKKLRGTCSILSFSMIYQNLGQLKVYETLEDAKRQNSSLFKMGPKLSRVLGETMSNLKHDKYILNEGKKMEKIDTYLEQLYLMENLEQINELDIQSLIKKIAPESKLKGILNKAKGLVNIKHPEKLLKISKAINSPKVEIGVIDRFMTSKLPAFKDNKNKSLAVLKNSLSGANNKLLNGAATFISIKSLYRKKNEKDDPKKILKNNIKEFVLKTRKFQNEYESIPEEKRAVPNDMILDYALGFTIVALALAFATALGSGLYVLLSGFAAVLVPIGTGIGAIVVTGIVLGVILFILYVLVGLGILKPK